MAICCGESLADIFRPLAPRMYTVSFRYQTDNWGHGLKIGGQEIPTSSSAYEWVSSDPNSDLIYFTTDEAMGKGYALMDMTQQE